MFTGDKGNRGSIANKGDMFSTVYMNNFSEHMAFLKIRNNSGQAGRFVCVCGESFYSHEEDIYVDFYNHIVDVFSNGKQERSAIEMIQFNIYCLEIMGVIKEKTFVFDLSQFISGKTGNSYKDDNVCEILTSKSELASNMLILYNSLLKRNRTRKESKSIENIIQQRNKYILSN